MKFNYKEGSKSAYYKEVSVETSFEAIGFIQDDRNAAENRLLLKPVGGKLIAYIGFPYTEFKMQAENNFKGFEAYFKAVVAPTYRATPYC